MTHHGDPKGQGVREEGCENSHKEPERCPEGVAEGAISTYQGARQQQTQRPEFYGDQEVKTPEEKRTDHGAGVTACGTCRNLGSEGEAQDGPQRKVPGVPGLQEPREVTAGRKGMGWEVTLCGGGLAGW